MSNKSILEIIQKSKGYDIALFTTFNFEISFFERFIKNALFSNKTKKVSLFVDSQELNKAINREEDTGGIGQQYVVNPIEMQGAFHPKVVLLLGKKKARLIVSSCNLSTPGYTINNEAFYTFDMEESSGNNKGLIISSIVFFEKLNDLSFHADDDLFKEIGGYKQLYSSFDSSNSDEPLLLHSVDVPIIEQLKAKVHTTKRIDIAVPYYDNSCKALKRLSNLYEDPAFNLLLQNKRARIVTKEIDSFSNIKKKPFAGFYDRNKNNNFYHGKVFRFTSDSDSYVMFGSANCTSSALLKSYQNGGNIEVVILLNSSVEETDEYFDNFKPYEGKTPEYESLKIEAPIAGDYYFRYGVLDQELHFYIGCSKQHKIVNVIVEREECQYSVSEGSIDVVVDTETFSGRSTVRIEINYDGGHEELIGWYTNPFVVNNTRSPASPRLDIEDVTLDQDSSKYIADQMLISKALALNIDEYIDEVQTHRMMLREKNSITDDEEEYGDGIIEYVIPVDNDYVYHSKLFKKLDSIKRHYYDRFFRFLYSKSTEKGKQNKEKTEENRIPRKPTTEEQRFRRFINKRIKGFISQDLVDVVSFEHYVACSTIFLDTFEKYSIHERVLGLFDDELTAMNRLTIVRNLLSLIKDDPDQHFGEVVYMATRAILVNRFGVISDVKGSSHINRISKELISEIESIKTCRKYITKKAKVIAENELHVNVDYALDYIDELYGYLPLERINEIMQAEFENEVYCKVDNSDPNVARTVVLTLDMKRYINYTPGRTIRELKKYNSAKKRWNKIVLDIQLDKSGYRYSKSEQLTGAVYEFNAEGNTYTRIMKRKSGKIERDRRYWSD